jgi:hypothetical protein
MSCVCVQQGRSPHGASCAAALLGIGVGAGLTPAAGPQVLQLSWSIGAAHLSVL